MMMETNRHRTLREWAPDEQPREKLQLKGKEALSDAELIAILLRTGTPQDNAIALARKLLESAQGNLVELSKFDINKLARIKGIGKVKAITLIAALELGRRRRTSEVLERKSIRSSRDAYELMAPRLADLDVEEFWIVMLNRANKVLETRKVSTGGITGTVADIRLIMRWLLEINATGFMAFHNHPSGQLKPSDADRSLTKNLKKAADFMDIQFFDHLIVTDSGYYSFADEGQL